MGTEQDGKSDPLGQDRIEERSLQAESWGSMPSAKSPCSSGQPGCSGKLVRLDESPLAAL